MSGQERFSYHQSEEINDIHKKQGAIHGAPYVLCVFALGVLMLSVGTFVTSHALEDKERDNRILTIVGPVILCLGGLFLVASVVVCLVAFCKNSQLQEALSEDLLNIGSSTFYGGRSFAYLVNDQETSSQQLQRVASEGFANLAGPPPNPEDEAVILLANTVAEERNRQRKYSKRHMTHQKVENSAIEEACPCGTVPCSHIYYADKNSAIQDQITLGSRYHLEHLGLEKLRRVDPYPELACDFDLGEGSQTSIRDRSASVYTRQQQAPLAPTPQRLRRNRTYTAASRARISSKRQQNRQQIPVEQGSTSPNWRKGSLQRKAKVKKDPGTPDIRIHQLPKYDQNLLSALGITPKTKDPYDSEYNSDPACAAMVALSQNNHQQPRKFPDKGHGSLHHPRRRPSMGTRGKMQQSSGSAYRHRSTIYASDMSLHHGRNQGITIDAILHQDQGLAPQDAHSSHSSQVYTRGSNSEVDVLHRSPKNNPQKMMMVGSWSSSSSPRIAERKRTDSQNSHQPRSSVSSSCSCRSERCSNDSCSDCDIKCGKVIQRDAHSRNPKEN